MRKKNSVFVAAGLFVLVVVASVHTRAQQANDPVDILIPAAGNQPEPDPGPPTDVLVFTGRSLGTLNTTGCVNGEHHLQKAVLVDPDGGRAPRTLEAIQTSFGGDVALRPGTRVKQFVFLTNCAIGGIGYRLYSGVID